MPVFCHLDLVSFFEHGQCGWEDAGVCVGSMAGPHHDALIGPEELSHGDYTKGKCHQSALCSGLLLLPSRTQASRCAAGSPACCAAGMEVHFVDNSEGPSYSFF